MAQDGGTTELEEIVVVGQRRPPGSTGGFGGGGGFGWLPEEQLQLPEDPNAGGGGPDLHPCQTGGSLDWNADAAAAEALKGMIDAALREHGNSDFANREYGALLCEGIDGRVSVGPIRWGDPILDETGTPTNPGSQPTVEIPVTDCGGGTIIGMVHTHPGVGTGTIAPSDSDVGWIDYINQVRQDSAGRIYIIARENSNESYKIYVYDERNSDSSQTGQPGPEVNPEGLPCP